MGLIEDYIRANILNGEEGNFNDRFIAFLARNYIVDGSPEGVIAAPPGAAAWNIQGGASTTLYVKESGTGDTGWVGYGAGGGGGGGFTQEEIEDFVGAMVSGNTETGIAVTYDDAGNKLNFVAEVTQAELEAVEDGAAADLATHAGGADPHTGYLKESEYIADERVLTGILDGGGSVITTGAKKAYIPVPLDCTITKVQLLADQAGSIVVDIWKDTYANFPPTVADTITASAKPTLSSAIKSQDTTLTGWTTALTAGDILELNVDSATTVTKVYVLIFVRP